MKVMYWLLGLVLGIPTLYFALMYGASELGGEVVILDRPDTNGDVSQVRIWIVDQDGISWVEHGAANANWITQLSVSPDVVLARGGQATRYVGRPDPDSHDLYHQLRQQKYGWADRTIEKLTGDTAECGGVPVRLVLVGPADG